MIANLSTMKKTLWQWGYRFSYWGDAQSRYYNVNIFKKTIRYITDNLQISSDDADKENLIKKLKK